MLNLDDQRHLPALDPSYNAQVVHDWLEEWAEWLIGGVGPGIPRCLSLESNYRSPQCWEAAEPRKDDPREWLAYRVEVLVGKLPALERAALRAEYTLVRQPNETTWQYSERKRRLAGCPGWMYQSLVDKAMRHIAVSMLVCYT